MSVGTNGNGKNRLDRVLYDTVQKLTEAQTEPAAAQQHSDEKLAALIDVVDSLVRWPPPQ